MTNRIPFGVNAMLATLFAEAFDKPGWVCEEKCVRCPGWLREDVTGLNDKLIRGHGGTGVEARNAGNDGVPGALRFAR